MKNILFHMGVIFLLFVMVVMNTGETASARSVYKHKIFSKSVVSKRIDTIKQFYYKKSKQLKTIGKLAFIPSLFNINEPLIFGLPLMYNPIMMIPFIIVMPLNGLITYLAMSSGIVARTFAYASWNMFSPIAALIDTMDIKAVLLIVVLIIIDILIYLPFFKAFEKEKLAEEQE